MKDHPGRTPGEPRLTFASPPGSPGLTPASPGSRELRAASLTRQDGKGNVASTVPESCPPPGPAFQLFDAATIIKSVRRMEKRVGVQFHPLSAILPPNRHPVCGAPYDVVALGLQLVQPRPYIQEAESNLT